jgi:hypothetical protein
MMYFQRMTLARTTTMTHLKVEQRGLTPWQWGPHRLTAAGQELDHIMRGIHALTCTGKRCTWNFGVRQTFESCSALGRNQQNIYAP